MSWMHRGHSPFWWTGEYRQRIEYPRLSAFICVHLLLTVFPGSTKVLRNCIAHIARKRQTTSKAGRYCVEYMHETVVAFDYKIHLESPFFDIYQLRAHSRSPPFSVVL